MTPLCAWRIVPPLPNEANSLAFRPAGGVCYLLMTLPLTGLARYLERRWAY